ncbi:MAG: DUF1858 domain-containing protein [candidate division WOR-3 bacterium]
MFTRETKIEDILEKFPEKAGIFVKMGLPCLVCGEPFWGTVEELCQKYNVESDKLLNELNKNSKGA